MPRVTATLIATLLLWAMPHAHVRAAIDSAKPNPWICDPAGAVSDLENQWSQFKQITAPGSASSATDKNRGVSIRGVLRFALEATAVGWDTARVEQMLGFGRSMQDLDPKSPTFGNFKWMSGDDKVYDRNAAEFAVQILGILHKCYADKLAPRSRELVVQMMESAIPEFQRRKVSIDYTNIWINKAWCLIAIGECLNRKDLADDGYKHLADWIAHTAQNGITEFGAVTYYGTDLDTLGMIEKHAARPEGRAQALAAIRYLWTDAAANWWPAGDRLGGANSRSPDLLWGHGYFEVHTWSAGWLREKPKFKRPGWLPGERDNLVTFLRAGYHPPELGWITPALTCIPRTVAQRCGPQPADIAVNWTGRRVNMASCVRERGGDARMFSASLGESPEIPQISFFMDGRGDPFGIKKTKNAAGKSKALHLSPFTATVQRGPEVLQLLSLEPLGPTTRHKPGQLSCFQSHLTVPAQAELWVGDNLLKPGSPRSPALVPAGAPIYIKLGDAVVAARILYADTTTELKQAPVHFIRDGSKAPANRITIVHDTGKPKGRASIAVWLRAAEGLDAVGFTAFRKQFASAQANVSVSAKGDRLTIETAGLVAPLRIDADVVRKIRHALEGGEPRPELFSVNGREVGRDIFAALQSR